MRKLSVTVILLVLLFATPVYAQGHFQYAQGSPVMTAGYTPHIHTVTYDANGGTCTTTSTLSTYDSTYSNLPTPTRTGYTFTGWARKTSDDMTVKTDDNEILIATWQPDMCTATAADITKGKVAIVNNDVVTGTGATASAQIASEHDKAYTEGFQDGLVNAPKLSASVNSIIVDDNNGDALKTFPGPTFAGISLDVPKKDYYDFTGWTPSTELDGEQLNMRFKAIWVPTTYAITYNLGGGQAVNPTSYNVETETITLNAPTKTGYTFVKWTEGGTIPVGSHGDKSFTAEWKANTYTLTYNSNGGSAAGTKAVTYDSAYGTLVTPSRTGYSFNGWYTASSGGTKINASDVYKQVGDQTVYAQWSLITYSITYNYNGGSGSNPTSYNVNSGTINLSTPSRSGYTFTGWSGSNTSGVISAGSTGDKSFTAGWKAQVVAGSIINTMDLCYDSGCMYHSDDSKRSWCIYGIGGTPYQTPSGRYIHAYSENKKKDYGYVCRVDHGGHNSNPNSNTNYHESGSVFVYTTKSTVEYYYDTYVSNGNVTDQSSIAGPERLYIEYTTGVY